MDQSRDSMRKKLEKFFAGKGFYIVLFLCAAVIGVSAWTLAGGNSAEDETETDIALDGGYYVADERFDEPEDILPVIEPEVETAQPEPEAEAEPETVVEAEPPEVVETGLNKPEDYTEQPIAFIWPVVGDIDVPYSVTALRYDATLADWRTHDGIDVAAALGTKVIATASGTVSAVYNDDLYGTTVVIDHGAGLMSIYSNLAEIPTVAAGDKVLSGETIGSVGDTALGETGQVHHLHFAMTLDGASVDPKEYLPKL